MNKAGFTLIEVVVAGLIFTIAVTGVFASLSAISSRTNVASQKSLDAALCGQKFLESLRAGVDQRDWADLVNSKLKITAAGTPGVNCTINSVNYTVTYEMVQIGTARKAKVTVTWP